MGEEWVHYMSIVKYKVNKNNGQVVHVSGFTKNINASQSHNGRAPKKVKKVQPKVRQEQEVFEL